MSLKGVDIQKGKVGSNASGDQRRFGLVMQGVAKEGGAQLGTTYPLRRPSDAEAIGITATYDKENNVRVYRHISEFYRMCGEGRRLYVHLVDRAAEADVITEAGKKLVVAADGMISDLGVALNPLGEETLLNGLPTLVYSLISKLKIFADWAWDYDMPLHTILEGRNISDTLTSLVDLRNFKISASGEDVDFEADKVTLVTGQDYTYADTLDAAGKKFADVGNYLGVLASQPWNCNPGEVESQNLTDSVRGGFLVGGLSNHKKYDEVFESLESLDEKGYVFPIKYQGMTGYWWNDGHTCAPIVVDAEGNMNQHTIYYSHTMNECKRTLRAVYLPEVKKPVELTDEGLLPGTMVQYYNSLGDEAFKALARKSLISSGTTETNPDSDLLIEKRLDVGFGVIPTGCVNQIVGTLNLKAK